MIERTCKILGASYGPYENVSYSEAAKLAVVEKIGESWAVRKLPGVLLVEVTDTESGVTRVFNIESSLRLEWVNPREVSGD